MLIQQSSFEYFILLLTYISSVFTQACFSYVSCKNIEEMFLQHNAYIQATRNTGGEGRMPSLSFSLMYHFRRLITLQVLKDQISAVELTGAPKIPKRNSRVLTLSVLSKFLRTHHAFPCVQPGHLLIPCYV